MRSLIIKSELNLVFSLSSDAIAREAAKHLIVSERCDKKLSQQKFVMKKESELSASETQQTY